ncbi:MAG: S24/S26 family peptidase [Acidimicrobiales bacterium]
MTTTTSSPPRSMLAAAPAVLRPVARRAHSALWMASWLYLSLHLCLIAWAALPQVALGWRSTAITSGSMRPAIDRGDLVLYSPPSRVAGGVGTLLLVEDHSGGGTILHRVTAVAHGRYRTKGDANTHPDPVETRVGDEVGVGRMLVPFIGSPIVWWGGGEYAMFAAWAGSVVLAAFTVLRAGASRRAVGAAPRPAGRS